MRHTKYQLVERKRTQYEPADTSRVRLRITELAQIDTLSGLDIRGGTVTNEQGLSTPLENHTGSLRNSAEVNLDVGEGENISRSRHGGDKRNNETLESNFSVRK
jgi:hypothetical protein